MFIRTPNDHNLKNMHLPEIELEPKIEDNEKILDSLIKSQLNYFMRLHLGFRFLRFVLEDGSIIEGTLTHFEEPTIIVEGKQKTYTINGNEVLSIKRIR